LTAAIKNELVATKKFRPEIAARINKVFVFKALEGIVMAGIIAQKMFNSARQYNLELVYIDPHLILKMMEANEKLKDFGVREMEVAIGDMLSEHFIAAKESGCKRIRLDMDEDGGTLTTEVE
jgi:ATP-dependent Clp protease ATP-binding subunit ClpA